MKRSEIYLQAAELCVIMIHQPFMCNIIDSVVGSRINVIESNFPELFHFKETYGYDISAWGTFQLNLDPEFHYYDNGGRMSHREVKTFILLFCAEMAKDTNN